jgi:transposase
MGLEYDLAGYLRLLLFGRILSPASKMATSLQNEEYHEPIVAKGGYNYHVYDVLDVLHDYKERFIRRMNDRITKDLGRNPKRIFYDVTNFFFETDEPDEDLSLPDGSVEKGLRQKGVSKENRKSPIVQMGLLMDEQGIPVSIECFPGNTLDMLTLSKAFSNSVSSISNGKERYVYVCDKGIGKGEAIQYAVSRGMGYITSRTVRGSSADEKKWILDQEGYKVVNENFRYKTRIVKKKTTAPDGTVLEYAEKVLTYWKRKYYEKEVAENQQFFEFVQEYLKNPSSFRLKSTQVPLIKKYLNKSVVNKKTGEIIAASDLSALLDVNKLRQDCELFGYYTIATSEINMDDMEILNTYSNLVEIEEQFHIMKSTLDTRPIFVRTKEHIIAHLTVCTIALILIRLIQRQVNLSHPDLLDPGLLFSNILSADRIQSALNKWKVEKLGDVYYRFCDSDNADLALILNSFGISIPTKCFRTQEIKQLKTAMQMST